MKTIQNKKDGAIKRMQNKGFVRISYSMGESHYTLDYIGGEIGGKHIVYHYMGDTRIQEYQFKSVDEAAKFLLEVEQDFRRWRLWR